MEGRKVFDLEEFAGRIEGCQTYPFKLQEDDTSPARRIQPI